MKEKKTKKNSIGTRAQVFNGTKLKTSGGLFKKDFIKNKHGRIVSIKISRNMKKNKDNPLAQGGFLRKKGDKQFGPRNKDKKSKTSKTLFEKIAELF